MTFQCKPAKFDGKYNGASMGLLNPCDEARRILGDINYGEGFAYLFRRFGYPEYGWDDYKGLVRYYITTPMDGVILSIEPGTSTVTSFGYMLRDDIHKKCLFEEFRPLWYWTKKFKLWAAKKYRVIPFDMFYASASKREINAAADAWISVNCKDREPTQEDANSFHEYKRLQCDKLRAEYLRIEGHYSRVNLWEWRSLPEAYISRQAMEAICVAIENLLMPVNIRDWYINIKGRVKDDDLKLVPDPEELEEFEVESAPYSEMAGMGFKYAAKKF